MKQDMLFYANYAITFLTLFIIGFIIPLVSRKEIFFGVRIPIREKNNVELKKLKREYRINYCISNVIFLAIYAVCITAFNEIEINLIAIFLYIFIISLNYIFIYFKAKKLKAEMKWDDMSKQLIVVDTKLSLREKNKMVASVLWFIVPISIIIISVAVGLIYYNKLPSKIPVHYNWQNVIDGWETKSYFTILEIPMVEVFITIVMFGSYKIFQIFKLQLTSESPKTSVKQNRGYRYIWSSVMIIMCTLVNLIFFFSELVMFGIITAKVMSILTITSSILDGLLIIAVALWTGQGGSNLKTAIEEKENGSTYYNDDKYWILGSIYNNPSDPSLFVEKRSGIGVTINFGSIVGKIIYGVVILIIMFSILSGIFLSKN